MRGSEGRDDSIFSKTSDEKSHLAWSQGIAKALWTKHRMLERAT